MKLLQRAVILFGLCISSLGYAIDGQFIQPNNLFPKVKIITSAGEIVVELDRSRAPMTVNNFLGYVADGSYENSIIHRIEPDFVIQGGGFTDKLENLPEKKPIFNESGNGKRNRLGTIAMARQNDPHTATRQFYFNMNDNDSLDPKNRWGYAVFGDVVEGMDVLEQIMQLPTSADNRFGWEYVPVKTLYILKVKVLDPPPGL